MRAFVKTPSPISALAAALFMALALSGCFLENDKSAGVDDFPNSIYARVDGFLDENKKAGGLEASAGPDSLLVRQSFERPALPKVSAAGALPPLAKRSAGAAACPATWTFSTEKRPDSARIKLDTLVVCLDSLS